MSDYFTRYAEAYALPNIQSSNVARVLIDFISRHESSSDAIDSPAVDAQIDPISGPNNDDIVEEYPPPLALPCTDMGDNGQNFVNILTQSSCVNQNQILNTTNSQDEIISDIIDDQNSDDFVTYSPVAVNNQTTGISNSQSFTCLGRKSYCKCFTDAKSK
ncbi:hypothetical protein AVEN_143748-1 [Araneus ventricosus]|uniref:Uncharacterized protein n=1 Tax=Araneus ventricosus TaxID=182803 RepID=A0A4Y2AQM3_ARAVE|nr:hypothetical protein AVEN_143748-1 [Araneus ventricosus]